MHAMREARARAHLSAAPSTLPKWQGMSLEAQTVRYRVAAVLATTSSLATPPTKTVWPAATRKLRGLILPLGSSSLTCSRPQGIPLVALNCTQTHRGWSPRSHTECSPLQTSFMRHTEP